MPTNNPVPSADPSDLLFNAERADDFVSSDKDTFTDRLGRERLTRTGIEKVARIDLSTAVIEATAAAEAYRDQAVDARDDAKAAAGAIGPLKFYVTYAQALADISNIPNDGLIEIARDETIDGARTRYFKRAGDVLEFEVNLDQLRIDLTHPTGSDPVGGFTSVDDIAGYIGKATYARVNTSGEFGWYGVDPEDSTSPTNRGSVVVDAQGRRWKRINADSVTPEMFGRTDTPALTAQAFNAAAEYCRASGARLKKGSTSYVLGGNVGLRFVGVDFRGCTITVNDGYVLTIGGLANSNLNPAQLFGNVKCQREWSLNPADYPNAPLRVMGSKCQTIEIGRVDRILFYMSTNPVTFPDDASCAYSKFFIDFAVAIDIDTDPEFSNGSQQDGPGSANQWFNENQLFLGRNIAFIMRGSYPHNNNRIHGGCYETSSALIDLQVGNKNWFTDVRGEGGLQIKFGQNTLANIIDANWFSSVAQVYERPPAAGSVVDNGNLNIVRDVRTPVTASDCVMLVSTQDKVHNGQPGNYPYRLATRKAIRGIPRTTARIIAESGYIGAEKGDYFFFEITAQSGMSAYYVARVYLYDAEFRLITPVLEDVESSVFASINPTFIQGTVNSLSKHHRVGIVKSSVRYVRFEILTSGSALQDNAVIIQVNRVTRMPGRARRIVMDSTRLGLSGFVTSVPTQFLGRVGDIVTGANADYRCVYMLETTLNAGAVVNAGSVTLASVSVSGLGAISNGDLIGIDLDDGNTHWTTVSSIAGLVVNLSLPTPSSASSGLSVYIARLSARS